MEPSTVRVRLFASLRELAGTPDVELELTGADSVESCWSRLCELVVGLDAWRGSVRPARNLQYVAWDEAVVGGDELAFLPPVSGGAPTPEPVIWVRVGPEPIDLAEMSSAIQRHGIGAIATFVGLVRSPDRGRAVRQLVYEAYPAMAEPVLVGICEEACQRFDASEARVQHRTGPVAAGVTSVAVVVGAAHRRQALDACGYIIDELKTRAPIWKSEE
ncbi:MAG TPA: molybdenum cofactor biosynthesis protein MoaE [Candidatus Dormibacteraeota bacterium]|nr:molybdenum cofactor biosynthesis protein MoaE [Candidatus Dormibacteraeota bacterium]